MDFRTNFISGVHAFWDDNLFVRLRAPLSVANAHYNSNVSNEGGGCLYGPQKMKAAHLVASKLVSEQASSLITSPIRKIDKSNAKIAGILQSISSFIFF